MTKVEISTLHELMRMDADTGHLFWRQRGKHWFKTERDWKRWNNRYAGKRAFGLNRDGYRDGMVLRQTYREHHVTWAMHYGEWPIKQIDHINGCRDDNRVENLRQVTRSENCRNKRRSANNTSGATGVYRHGERWRAVITFSLGTFDSFDEAVAARKEAEARFGFSPSHGEPRIAQKEQSA